MSWTPPRTISVVIATHNRLTELDALLHDLANQTVSAHEVIVVDSDAAADSRPLVEFHARRGLNVKHLITENVVAIKRNAGAARASGGLVVFLDDDLRVGRGFLAAHLAAHRQPRIVASGKVTFPEDWVHSSNYYRFKSGRHEQTNSSTIVPPHRFVSMNNSIELVDYEALGGYDDDYRMYGGEDLDFGFRAQRAGLKHVLAAGGSSAEHHEVKMGWTQYVNKVHKAAYFGLPLVLAKNPEARRIPTVILSAPGVARDPRERALAAGLHALAHRPVLRLITAALSWSDRYRVLHLPVLQVAATLLANRIGFSEQAKGREYAPIVSA